MHGRIFLTKKGMSGKSGLLFEDGTLSYRLIRE